MPRIVYLLFSDGGIAGGHKMIVRHVETLRELGFDAICYVGAQSQPPSWFSHSAPIELGTPVRPDDIIVVPDDSKDAMEICAKSQFRTVVFSQSIYNFAATTYDILDRFSPDRFPHIIAIAPRQIDIIRRAFPHALVESVPCFADERVFSPAAEKRAAIAFTARKRPLELAAIQQFTRRFHPRHSNFEWAPLSMAPEAVVAQTFAASSLFLSLSRLEAVGITTLEAMASGCVCAGFTGLGGWEFAHEDNGFWVGEDDCLAAADALAQAADLVFSAGAPLRRLQEAGRETANLWSYAKFRASLERAWTTIAPDARLRNRPLD